MMNNPDKPILHTEHLSRMVNGRLLVDDISIDVQPGDVLAVVGPSGAGKSSFLRMLNRLDEPTGGAIFLEGLDTREIPPRLLRRRVGMVMQSPYLFPGSVADNLRYGPAQRGETIPTAAIDALLAQVGLAGYGARDVNHLSGGEAQRVSLARTLANRPQILLLDEPTSALDDAAEHDVEALLCHIIQQEGLTCLIITHDLDQAARMANRVMMMENGRLITIGPVEELLNAKSTV